MTAIAAPRIALVEDHAVLAEALHLSLSSQNVHVVTIQLPPPGSPPSALLTAILGAHAGVVLLDLDLGSAGDGGRLIQPLTRSGKRVVVLTASRDLVRWGECLARGALTVLPKTAPLQVIVDSLDKAAQGLPVMPHGRRQELMKLWSARSSEDNERLERLNRLSPREAHVLGELVKGKRVRDIAKDSYVSEATVRTQVKSILAKLHVGSQLAAVAMARDAGWGPTSRTAS